MTTATIFAYKGNVGVEIDHENGKFLNDPNAGGQMGCVISTSEVAISKEAKDIIMACKQGGGSFSELMLTEHADADPSAGKSSIGVMGFGKIHLGTDFEIGRTCTKSVLNDCTEVPNVVPQDYMDFIDDGVAEQDD